MPANHKVSVAWQIVATFVPIANFWAFYRIRKLRKYVLYVIVPEIVVSIALLAYYYSVNAGTAWGDDALAFGDPSSMFAFQVLGGIVGYGLQGFAIYLVIIWSRQHNKVHDTTA